MMANQRIIFWITLLSSITTTYCQQTTTSTPSIITSSAQHTHTPTASCGLNGNTDTICSPKAGDVWQNGTWYPITWNPLYPTYASAPLLDIYIYFVQNYQNVLIKQLTGIKTSKGSVPVLIDDTWRLDTSAKTYDSLVYLVPTGLSPEKEFNNMYSDYPPPIHNLVAQAALVPLVTALPSNISSIISSTIMPTPTNQILISPPTPPPSQTPSPSSASKDNDKEDRTVIQPGIIAAIVLACLAVVGACIAVFWVMRHSRRRKLVYGEKGHLELRSTASSSMFPMNHVDSSSREKLHYQNNSSVSITNPSAVHNNNNYSNFSSDAVVMSSPLLTAGNGPTRLLGTSNINTERGSLKCLTAPTTPVQPNNKQSFGFMSVPSLPLMEDHSVYMLGDSENRPQSTASFSNISSRSEPPLTSTDALLIADTFRQRMRRPDWQQQQQQQKQQSQEDKEQEEDQRRQLSEDLLKKELEAEGTLMKKVGKRAHLLPASYRKDQGPS